MSEKNRLNITYIKRAGKGIINKTNKKGFFRKIIIYLFFICVIAGIIVWMFVYTKYLSNLPSVKELENLDIARSSTIYDRDGNELYKIFKEKRTYIPYSSISKNMVNAIVAGEDKKFFTNPGVDISRLIGAFVNYGLGRTSKVEGTSTITQQLIRNTIIENEKSYERKIKELYLSYKVSQSLSKEKILELYLNKISFGSNAYGIEQASLTFFGKRAKDLGVLESSVLASLPKGPTEYSPYRHPDRVLGYPFIGLKEEKVKDDSEETGDDNTVKILTKKDASLNKEALNRLVTFLKSIKAKRVDNSNIILCSLKKEYFKGNVNIDGDGCSITKYEDLLTFLNSIRIDVGEDSYIEYQTGRKDFILGRMLEDGYIEFDSYINAILTGIAYDFKEVSENSKYSHFIFYVKEYLEKKYGKELVEKGGLEIYTTIDPKLQDKAEELIKKATSVNGSKYGASNSALVSIDNTTGEILSMVGGKDFNNDGDGNVNIITSKLQPGSSFKPFVYSLAMFKKAIGTKTPIYDIKTKFPGGYDPKNFDGKFEGKINVSTALNGSRNIPAIKMYFLAGGAKEILPFMNKLGVYSLTGASNYGPSLALGAGELTPLELASAYSVFANLGEKKEITPILKVLDSKKNIIEESKQNKSTHAVDPVQAYLINYILSDTSSRPSGWNPFLTLKGRKVAAKTGTSTKESSGKGKKIYPRNLWTVGYTPQITTVVWSGNTDGKETKMNADGLNVSGPIWRDFMEFAHKGKTVLNWKEPEGVKTATISNITGYISNGSFGVVSLFKNLPTKKDSTVTNVQVDILCNGKVSDKTPASAIKIVSLLDIHSEDPENPDWEASVQEWIRGGAMRDTIGDTTSFVTYISDKECDREGKSGNIQVSSSINSNGNFVIGNNYVEIKYDSENPVKKIYVFVDNERIQEINIDNFRSGIFKGNIVIPDSFYGTQNIKIQAVDSMYYSGEESKTIKIGDKIKEPPKINVTNPGDLSIKIYNDQSFILKGSVLGTAVMRSINFYLDGKPLKLGSQIRDFAFPVDGKSITPGVHEIKVEAVDFDFNVGTQTVKLEILTR